MIAPFGRDIGGVDLANSLCYLTMRGWRHDYHNHLQTLKARMDMGQSAGAREYLDRLEQPWRTRRVRSDG